MVLQISPEEYFRQNDKVKEKVSKEKEEKAKKLESETQKAKLIFKPGQQPMIVYMPPVKVIINLDKCPHCGLHVGAQSEIEEGGEQ